MTLAIRGLLTMVVLDHTLHRLEAMFCAAGFALKTSLNRELLLGLTPLGTGV